MNKSWLGLVTGAVLGALDGLSAWLSPEARPQIVTIVVGSTMKGLVTGLRAGLISRRRQSTPLGVLAGLAIGFVLSSIAAIDHTGHYLEIVLPGNARRRSGRFRHAALPAGAIQTASR
jgi:hypothetical protein